VKASARECHRDAPGARTELENVSALGEPARGELAIERDIRAPASVLVVVEGRIGVVLA
jgi:hypothetical protein